MSDIVCPPEMPFEECLKRLLKGQTAQESKNTNAPTIGSSSSSSSSPLFLRHSSMGSYSSYSHNHSSSVRMSFSNISTSSRRTGKSGNSYGNTSPSSKGGVVVKNQTIIVKSNFEMAGRLNKQGKRPNAKAVGSHASASLSYMDNHGAKDLEYDSNLSNTYDENGERLNKDELSALKKELDEGISAFRRTIIDVGQKEFDRDDLNRLVRESMQELKEQSGKSIDYVYSVHTDKNAIHAHVLSYGKSSDVNFTKEHLKLYKEIVADKTHDILNEKTLEQERDISLKREIDKHIDKELDEQSKEHSNILQSTLSH